MRQCFALVFFLASLSVWACVVPTTAELQQFFEGESRWTEVENEKSFLLALKRPVFLQIDFKKGHQSKIKWGSESVDDSRLSLCWRGHKRNRLQIRRGFFGVTLIKVSPGLMKSWIPIDGDLYYRKDSEVIRPVRSRDLAEESKS